MDEASYCKLIGISLDSAYLLEKKGKSTKMYRVDSKELRGCIDRINFERKRICANAGISPDSANGKEIMGILEENYRYRPKEVGNLNSAGSTFGLAQARYIPLERSFASLDEALGRLHRFWVRISQDPEGTHKMVSLERIAQENAEKGINEWIGKILGSQ